MQQSGSLRNKNILAEARSALKIIVSKLNDCLKFIIALI